jgi:dGTPase
VIELLAIPSREAREKLDERRAEEPAPSVRTEAQRDRDRVLYSAAFMRLGHVTQVAAPEPGYLFHSRLTHSLKVGQVARGMAQRLKARATAGEFNPGATALVEILDEDATEAAALAHDLGHPPFGHLAEKVLDKNSRHANFEGNPQSFRIVTRLATPTAMAARSEEPVGLNLTRRTLNGILKYPWLWAEEPELRTKKWGAYADGDRRPFEWARRYSDGDQRSLEACLMDWADDVTYAVHDIDDFFRAGIVPLERLSASSSPELERFVEYVAERGEQRAADGEDVSGERFRSAAKRLFEGGVLSSIDLAFSGSTNDRITLRQLSSDLIAVYISALDLRDTNDGSVVELVIDDDIVDQIKVLKELTWFYVINRPSLSVIQRGQRQVIETLFDTYRKAIAAGEEQLLPPLFAERLASANTTTARERVAIDLISGMTEASAIEVYRQRVGVVAGSLLTQVAGHP